MFEVSRSPRLPRKWRISSSIFLILLATNFVSAETFPIYYASIKSAKERQDAIKSELSKVSLEGMVFAKFKDFMDEVNQKKPNVVIAPAFFSEFHPEYRPVLQFSSGNEKSFKYLLLALNGDWKSKDKSQGKIGVVVEEVDHDHLKDLVSELTGSQFKLLRSVVKPEDLFPLLVFKSVDFIMVSPDNYRDLREKFNTKVVSVMESKSVNLATVFIKKDTSPEGWVEKFKDLSPEFMSTLGFSRLDSFEGEKK